jgi:hypothetical protein
MNKFLVDDKLPYFFTVLIGLFAYQINHLVAYVTEAPTVAYNFEVTNKEDYGNIVIEDVELKIENINRKLSFSNLVLDVKYSSKIADTPKQVYEPQLVAIAPSTALPDSVVSSRHQLINRYEISNLQPGGIYVAKLKIRHNKTIVELPKVYLNSTNTILLTENNLEVKLVKNQFLINSMLLFIWLCLIIFYFIKLLIYNKTG